VGAGFLLSPVEVSEPMSADRPMSGLPEQALDRRAFLGQAAGVITGVLAVGSPFALMAPSRAWAIDLAIFSSVEGATLMAVARTIAPHDRLEDAAYALVVKALDTAAAQDEALRRQLKEGLDRLGVPFASKPEDARAAALKNIEATPFFQTVRAYTLRNLYTSPLAYSTFGYEGEAFSKGGYLGRGFNDLRWLPEVPLPDSGPI
jgi:hypothetical protein